MTPYYQDDLVTLYHGDARDVLPSLPRSSVDLLLTDPPYGMGYGGDTAGGAGSNNVAADGVRQGIRVIRQVMFLGRLGWHGQCACCCGPDDKRQIKRQEERQWRREVEDDTPECHPLALEAS